MNVSSKTALTRELKPFEIPFLSTDDLWFSWLKYQILKYFEDWLKSLRNKKCLYNHKSIKGIKITVHTVIELTYTVLNYA